MEVHNPLWKMHDEGELLQIDAAAIRLLGRAGCRIEHEGLLRQLEGAGCRVIMLDRRAFFPEKLVRNVVDHCKRQLAPEVSWRRGWTDQHCLWLSGSHPHFLDWPSGDRRLATRQDVIEIAKMGHMLPEFKRVGRALTCAEIDPRIEPLWTTLTLAEITDKPLDSGEIYHAHTIEPLVRMGETLSGKPGDITLANLSDFFISPLILDRAQAECFVEKRRFNVPTSVGSMPISGMSSPVTLAGTVALAVAELLAGWVLSFVIAPDLPVSGGVASGSLDMRTANACFGTPEALLQNLTTVQLCRRLYGIPVWTAINYIDAKRPGLEAAFQKMYPLIAAPFGTGMYPGGDGLLSAGQDYSPVQHLLDLEMRQAVGRLWAGFEISQETLAEDLIEKMIASGKTNFLDTAHTAAHYKQEQWYPRWFDRTPWQGQPAELDAEDRMLKRIDQYWKNAAASYQPPQADKPKLAELRRIYTTAEKTILGK